MNNSKYRIVIAGDILPSGKNIELFKTGDTKRLFSERICDLFSNADFSIVNLEGALTNSIKKQEKTGPALKASTETINGIKQLGVTAVALANNHITDYGHEGYIDTITTLDNAGIQYVGAGPDNNNIKKYLTLLLGNKRVCIYNVSESFFNVPTDSTAGVNIYDEYVVCKEIKELKQNHDYVIVLYHGGAEEFPYPTPLVMKRFHRMADNGADFISAQHTHCIGCYEKYNNSYLLYGQGNFLFARMKNDITKHGLVSVIEIDDNDISLNHHSFTVTSDDVVVYDADQDFNAFNKRSLEINNEKTLYEKYKEYIYNFRLKTRTLKAYKGNSLYVRILNKFFYTYYANVFIEKYTREQLIRMRFSAESDRYSEDLAALFSSMIDKKMKK